jgi:hypothetical protein
MERVAQTGNWSAQDAQQPLGHESPPMCFRRGPDQGVQEAQPLGLTVRHSTDCPFWNEVVTISTRVRVVRRNVLILIVNGIRQTVEWDNPVATDDEQVPYRSSALRHFTVHPVDQIFDLAGIPGIDGLQTKPRHRGTIIHVYHRAFESGVLLNRPLELGQIALQLFEAQSTVLLGQRSLV